MELVDGKIISNEITFIYKYILPILFLSFSGFLIYITISNKIYLFTIIIMVFIVFFFITLKKYIKLKFVRFTSKGLLINNYNKTKLILWKEIRQVKYKRNSIFFYVTTQNYNFYFIPSFDYFVFENRRKLANYIIKIKNSKLNNPDF